MYWPAALILLLTQGHWPEFQAPLFCRGNRAKEPSGPQSVKGKCKREALGFPGRKMSQKVT